VFEIVAMEGRRVGKVRFWPAARTGARDS